MNSRTQFERGSNGIVAIDLAALTHNYRMLRAAARPGRCGAVVKADAYGLGATVIASCLHAAGCRDFFVADLPEGARIRALLPDANIFIFDGPSEDQFDDYKELKLRPVLNTREQVVTWSNLARTMDWPAPVAVHIDTGMTRLGLDQSEILDLRNSGVLEPLDLSLLTTHLACADDPDNPLNAKQRALFAEISGLFAGVPTSIANSAATLSGYGGDLARPGIALYGSNPFCTESPPDERKEVIHWQGRILQRRSVPAGTPVGYGATYTTGRESRLLTIGVGYGDGYLRSLGNRGYVMVAGQRAPVVGRVSMDSLVVDVTDLPESRVLGEDRVSLVGGGVDIDELAGLAGTISYELLTRIGPRIQRVYLR